MIALDGVTVRYGPSTALYATSPSEVEPGEWVGLIGPNGAGKTTLLRAVAGLVAPRRRDHGSTRPVPMRWRPGVWPGSVAYVPQQPELPPDMTVGQYVLLGRTPHIGYFGSEIARGPAGVR